MVKPEMCTGWLAVGSDGSWNLVGFDNAENGDKPDGDSAGFAIEPVCEEAVVYSLHRVTFTLPDLPTAQGEDIGPIAVGDAE